MSVSDLNFHDLITQPKIALVKVTQFTVMLVRIYMCLYLTGSPTALIWLPQFVDSSVSISNVSLPCSTVPPIVTTPPGPPIVAAVGENITLTCEANGSPASFITWRKNLQSLPLDTRYVVSSKNGVGTLTVQVRAIS